MRVEDTYESVCTSYCIVTMIDHMGLDDTGATSFLFGTTRSANINFPGTHVFIWRVALLSSSSFLDTSSVVVREIDEQDQLDIRNFVSGVKKTLTDNGDMIHMVLYTAGSEDKLYYLKASYSSGDSTAVLLNEGIDSIKETFFVGSTTETVGAESEVYQSYSVGYERD